MENPELLIETDQDDWYKARDKKKRKEENSDLIEIIDGDGDTK
tara:strand:+ start:272 stop:400 length:129 start_codon:yes stop_codon:yes gene_type:complete